MRRLILALALASAILLVGADAVGAQTPRVVVVPGSASQFQTLTVSGSGFAPGATLRVTFISPGGEEIVYSPGGGAASITVESSGRFRIFVVPAVDFAGARAGRWLVAVCPTEDGDCVGASFTVRS